MVSLKIYIFLIKIISESAKLLCGEILLRSQNRVEDQLKIHKEHTKELEELKQKFNITMK